MQGRVWHWLSMQYLTNLRSSRLWQAPSRAFSLRWYVRKHEKERSFTAYGWFAIAQAGVFAPSMPLPLQYFNRISIVRYALAFCFDFQSVLNSLDVQVCDASDCRT
jgi:hypothetical protein